MIGNSTTAVAITLPTATGTLATLAGTETFTNKTLTAPTLTTPTLGVASATSINKITLTQPTNNATLTLGDQTTVTTAGNISLIGNSTTAVAITLPTAAGTLATTASPTFTGTVTAPTYLATSGITVGASALNTTYLLYVDLTTSGNAYTGALNSVIKYFNTSTSSTALISALSSAAATNVNLSIYSKGAVVSGVGFYAASDKRIKYNIHDNADIPSIQLLRYLKPRIFNFIDESHYGTDPTWGFIAQEVKEIIPNAVTYGPNFIPNIFEVAEIIGKEIKLGTRTTTELLKDENSYYPLQVKNTKGDDKIVKITEIIDEKTFKIEEDIETEHNKIFVYGQEVPDFHSLDKDMIFTITTSAVQELDKELQETNKRVKSLEEENQTLKQQISEILERLSKANL